MENNKDIRPYLYEFLASKVTKWAPYSSIAASLLIEGNKYSLNTFPDYENPDKLSMYITESVKAYTRSKDSAIAMYKDFVTFLSKRGVEVSITFPPIPVDSSFERLMFIAKYLQNPDAEIDALEDILWISKRTIDNDLQRLRGNSGDPLQICGRKFIVNETERHSGQMHFASTVHPLFLTENLTQIIAMLKGLKIMSENVIYKIYAETTAAEIWEQLSDYAKQRIHTVLKDLLDDDPTWFEELEGKDPDRFHREPSLH